jgi:hypothetical protein
MHSEKMKSTYRNTKSEIKYYNNYIFVCMSKQCIMKYIW